MTTNANDTSGTRCPCCGAAMPCHQGHGPDRPHCGCPDPHRGRHCEPPPRCPDPGTVDVPQDQPPPKVKTGPQRPGQDPGRPPRNTPQDQNWFKDRVRDTLRDGPRFGPRKDEYLPFLLVRSAAGDAGERPAERQKAARCRAGRRRRITDVSRQLRDRGVDLLDVRGGLFPAIQANLDDQIFAHALLPEWQ